MKQLATATGSRFQYKEHLDGEIIVYPADEDGQSQDRSAIVITPYTIGLVRRTIKMHGRIYVGASRDKPPPGSLGALIKEANQTPQQLSYLIPILASLGVCAIERDGRAIVARWLEE